MKRYFVTGLVIILPLVITAWITTFFVSLCTRPFEAAGRMLLSRIQLFQAGWWVFSAEQLLKLASTLFVFLAIILSLGVIGWLGRLFFLRYIIRCFDRLVRQIPLVNRVYKACYEFTDILFSSKSSSFSKVVWAPFPTSQQRALGLVTNEFAVPVRGAEARMYTSVLLPGTPNPTVGFLVLYPADALIGTPLPLDVTMKWVISCGSADAVSVLQSASTENPEAARG